MGGCCIARREVQSAMWIVTGWCVTSIWAFQIERNTRPYWKVVRSTAYRKRKLVANVMTAGTVHSCSQNTIGRLCGWISFKGTLLLPLNLGEPVSICPVSWKLQVKLVQKNVDRAVFHQKRHFNEIKKFHGNVSIATFLGSKIKTNCFNFLISCQCKNISFWL